MCSAKDIYLVKRVRIDVNTRAHAQPLGSRTAHGTAIMEPMRNALPTEKRKVYDSATILTPLPQL
jgi:hypothetical protein